MKKRNTILLFGILSIIILITVQIIIIRGVWQQKDEMFNLRYRLYSQDALSAMSRRWSTDGFDTARLIISNFSAKSVKEFIEIKDDSLLAKKKQDIMLFVRKVLNQEQDLSQWLSNFFERMGVEKNFDNKIVINFFDLIVSDSVVPIYVSEETSNRRLQRQGPPPQRAGPRRISEILVKGDRWEDNNYRLDFDYYIDFSDKQKVILKETSASLAMSIFSMLVVVILFHDNLQESDGRKEVVKS